MSIDRRSQGAGDVEFQRALLSAGLEHLLDVTDPNVLRRALGHMAFQNMRLAEDNKELSERLDKTSIDQTTGCLRKDAFFDAIKVRYDHHNKGVDTAVIVLDLKGVKGANDSYGHDKGDNLFESTGPALRGLTREGDYIARLGGDEFAIVMDLQPTGKSDEEIQAMLEARFNAVFNGEPSEDSLRAPFDEHLDMIVAARHKVMICKAPTSSSAIVQTLINADRVMTEQAKSEKTRGAPPILVPKR